MGAASRSVSSVAHACGRSTQTGVCRTYEAPRSSLSGPGLTSKLRQGAVSHWRRFSSLRACPHFVRGVSQSSLCKQRLLTKAAPARDTAIHERFWSDQPSCNGPPSSHYGGCSGSSARGLYTLRLLESTACSAAKLHPRTARPPPVLCITPEPCASRASRGVSPDGARSRLPVIRHPCAMPGCKQGARAMGCLRAAPLPSVPLVNATRFLLLQEVSAEECGACPYVQ